MKIKIVKDVRGDYKSLKVQASQDGVKYSLLLQALVDYKDQQFLSECFDQKNVSAWAKIGTRYHPLGYIPKDHFDQFKNLKN